MKGISNSLKNLFNAKSIRAWMLAIADVACVFFAMFISILICKIDSLNGEMILRAMFAMPILAVISFFNMIIFGNYKCIWRYATFSNYLKLALSSLSTILLFTFLDKTLIRAIDDLAVYFVMFFALSAILILTRVIYAFIYFKLKNENKQSLSKKTMIIGAGNMAKSILEELVKNRNFYNPVCIIDDDADKIGRTLLGVPVVGSCEFIPKFAKKYEIETIIFAIPSIGEERKKVILGNCLLTDCEVKILPMMSQMIDNVNLVKQIKDIVIEDLLGRMPIVFESDGIKDYIENRVCMITGGGGSIGSELCRQIANLNPLKIVIVDNYENSAYSIEQEIFRIKGRDFPLFVEIASVTDYDKLQSLFEQYHPNILFHAAAHKHVPLMEQNPEAAVKNNVFGTLNVARLANKFKVNKFIMISTDKAVNPTNVMGATKRCCEMIVQSFAQQSSSTEFASVRFGNVLGSNGSVIPLFQEQIKNGGPVYVTHKDIIRYFMTISEAVSLVLQAGAYAKGGEIFILDMGSPVRILNLAENLIRMMGYKPYEEIEIKFTGLRPGEKLFEELLMGAEGINKTDNNKIFVGQQVEIDIKKFEKDLDCLKSLCETNEKEKIVEQLKNIVPTYKKIS